jgi:hypothetical protein
LERGREGRGMRVKDLGRKKERVWRERGKKGENQRETYERIQCMRKKKRLRRIIISKLNFWANRFCFDILLMLKSRKRGSVTPPVR